MGIKNCFLVKLRHVTGKCLFIKNRMLCSILFSIVNKKTGKKVHFCHNKDHFCSCFFILTTSFARSGYFSENTKPLYSHFSGKLNHSHRKYSRKKFYRRIFLKCDVVQYLVTRLHESMQLDHIRNRAILEHWKVQLQHILDWSKLIHNYYHSALLILRLPSVVDAYLIQADKIETGITTKAVPSPSTPAYRSASHLSATT